MAGGEVGGGGGDKLPLETDNSRMWQDKGQTRANNLFASLI